MKTRYEIVETKASPFGRLYVLSEFLHQIKFHKFFDSIFGKLRSIRSYHPADSITTLIASIIAGGERLYDIQRFSADPVVRDLFELKDIPHDTTIRDDLKRIGEDKQDRQRQEFVFQLNEMLFEKHHIKSITIDVDGTATPVDGHQAGAEKGYCPQELGSRCFQSLIAICDDTETVIAEQTRSGETHCANGTFRHYYVERTKNMNVQGELFESTDYSYRVIISNKERQPHVVVNHYNKRGRCEKSIEELKNQFALGKMVSQDFAVTKALFWISYLSFTIIGILRFVAFRRQMVRYRLRRLRFILFTAIGYYVLHARKKVYKLALPRVGQWQFINLTTNCRAFNVTPLNDLPTGPPGKGGNKGGCQIV